jgi:hypothetical protein
MAQVTLVMEPPQVSAAPVVAQTVGDLFPEWGKAHRPDLASTSYIGSKGPAQRVLATDVVKGVVGLDRQKFAAANAAKRRVHVYHGSPGTLAYSDNANCMNQSSGPCVLPMAPLFCPIICPAHIYFATCEPHRDMDWPDWADKALMYTEHGIVGKSKTAPDAKPNAILWGGFNVDKVQVRRYDNPRDWQNLCNQKAGLDARPIVDPLTCTLLVGCLCPCCYRICIQPDDALGLYHLVVESTHMSSYGDSGSFPTARISLIALAPGPEACLEELRSMAAAAAAAPAAATMARGDEVPRARARGRIV